MAEPARSPAREGASAPAPQAAPKMRGGASPAVKALALQRAVGNRAAARVLARWAPHPDKEKKGMFMTDAAAAEYNRFNPPLSK
jgi:hypothetical protein